MIDEKIAYEQRKISQYAVSLREWFIKIDSLLGTDTEMQKQLTSAIDKLSSD